jgi:hypothetical protein
MADRDRVGARSLAVHFASDIVFVALLALVGTPRPR